MGTIASVVANFSMGAPDRMVMARDFIPDYILGEEKQNDFDLRMLTPEQQRDYLLSLFGKRTHRVKR